METDHVDAPSLQPLTSEDHENHENTGVEDKPPMTDTITSMGMMENNQDIANETTGVELGLDMASQTTGVEQSLDEDDSSNTTPDYDHTEEAEYE